MSDPLLDAYRDSQPKCLRYRLRFRASTGEWAMEEYGELGFDPIRRQFIASFRYVGCPLDTNGPFRMPEDVFTLDLDGTEEAAYRRALAAAEIELTEARRQVIHLEGRVETLKGFVEVARKEAADVVK